MKRVIALFLLLSIGALPAFALVPKPYIGVNLQSNSPTGDFKGHDLSNKEGDNIVVTHRDGSVFS